MRRTFLLGGAGLALGARLAAADTNSTFPATTDAGAAINTAGQ